MLLLKEISVPGSLKAGYSNIGALDSVYRKELAASGEG